MEIRILTDAEREEYIHLLSVAFAMPMSHWLSIRKPNGNISVIFICHN